MPILPGNRPPPGQGVGGDLLERDSYHGDPGQPEEDDPEEVRTMPGNISSKFQSTKLLPGLPKVERKRENQVQNGEPSEKGRRRVTCYGLDHPKAPEIT